MRQLFLLLFLGGLLLGAAVTANAAAPVVIVHPDVQQDSIDEETLGRVYQGKVSRWEDGSAVVPVMIKAGPTHETFVQEIVGTTPARFSTYWKQAVFSGRGIPPKSFDSELNLVEFVASTPGAVGYVSPLTPLRGVKVLTVED